MPAYKTKNNSYLYFYLYFVVFIFAFLYVFINPEAGRDYHSYLKIISSTNETTPLKEFGFYYSVKLFIYLGFSPETVMLLLRVVMYFLLLRFFYFSSNNYKLFGVVFFLFIPNVFIGSLNALQTWLAIAIFLQAFIGLDKIKDDKVLIYAILAFLFHSFSILYLLLFLSYKYFNDYFKVVVFFLLISTYNFLEEYISGVLGLFGYLRYLDIDVASTKFYVLSLAMMLVFIVTFIFLKNKKIKKIYLDLFFAVFLFGILVKIIGVGNELALRALNFFLPFIWLAIVFFLDKFTNKISVVIVLMLSILIVSNFFATVNFNGDMLNLSGFRQKL